MSTLLIDVAGSELRENENFLGVGESKDGILKNIDPEFIPRSKGIIDVVNNFSWYTGPKSNINALNKVPRALITERRQVLNSLISGALYYLNVIGRTTAGVAGGVGEGVAGEQNINKLKSYLRKLNESNPVVKSVTDSVQKFINKDDRSLLESNNLLSLLGIYYTEKTGFEYVFPYYGNMPEITNSWGSGGEGAIAGLVNSGMEAIDEISKITNITQPGVYIQKPKYFNFAEEGKSITVSFPLFNTIKRGTQSPYQQNYELLWLLAFQNRPYKTSFARTPPPKIYTVQIPGVYSTPYSYISSLSIDFRGTVRRLSVNVPHVKGKSKSVKSTTVPIPEAYVVNITFTSLLNDFANQMVGNAFTSSIEGNKAIVGAGT